MKKVYAEKNTLQCDMMKALLEENDIYCFFKNETMSAMFGPAGYNPHQAYPELWVDDEDFDKAKKLIAQSENKIKE